MLRWWKNFLAVSPKELLEQLNTKKGPADTCFIIGGGSSIKKYLPDPSVLNPFKNQIIGTNNAYQMFPDCLVNHFADKVWFNWHEKKDIRNLCKAPLSTCTRYSGNKFDQQYWLKLGVTPFRKGEISKGGVSTVFDLLHGQNAGHQAINLAYLIGFRKIVLFGFDMNPKTKETHWHNQHQTPTNVSNYEAFMLPGMRAIAADQLKLDFRVYNINKESNIKCFEFAELKDFI